MGVTVQLFARAPQPYLTKTRLIPLLGPEGAAQAHARLLTHMAAVVRAWCAQAPDRRFCRLWCDPHPLHPFFATLFPPERLRSQCGGDLGARMGLAVEAGLQEGGAVILLGGDGVSVDGAVLDRAEAALAAGEAVLAPAEDGGYVLLGLRQQGERLFEEMPWGSGTVAALTRQRLTALGWRWQELDRLWDVDRPEDWARFQGRGCFL